MGGRETRRNGSWGPGPFQPGVGTHKLIYNLLLIAGIWLLQLYESSSHKKQAIQHVLFG